MFITTKDRKKKWKKEQMDVVIKPIPKTTRLSLTSDTSSAPFKGSPQSSKEEILRAREGE